MNKKEKIERATDWLMHSDEGTIRKALEQLVEFAIRAEYVNISSPEDAALLADETGKPISEYEAPYFTSCGEPLGR